MTSTTDTAGHPDVAEISDLTEGLLPPSRTADLRRHLDECELCADVHASLKEIRGLLGTLPGPARMPNDVAERIDAALAAEALLSATAPDDIDQPKLAAPVPSVSDADDGTHVSRETSAAGRPAGYARSSTTGPGRKNHKKTGRRKVAVLSAAFTAAALGLGSVLLTSLMGGSGSGPSADGGQTTGDTFSAAKLEKQVSSLLAKNESSVGSSRKPEHSLGIEGGPETESPRVFRENTVPQCIRKGIGRNDAALATEEGVYKGKDALLVVLPDASDVSRVTVYVMDATCVKHPSSMTAEVLLKDSYARR
ncbi:anti-sigma factor family protein [Streptomyces bicolor]|uniref:anti-sigma factor family protein n=1 Tax=Streptomyces bicolor TaxID=66874 RepID=UPI0004E27257|nr:membrane protein [Streptomyces bicolor]